MGSENRDRLSSLPDDVLSHILDLIPTKLAVQTSILAKRWRHSWKYVTKLHFDDMRSFTSLDSFTKYVDQVLKLYKTTHVKSFRLDCEMLVPSATTLKWIDEAIRLNVSELEIHPIPLELHRPFVCKTLTRLALCWEDRNITFPIDLPLLKTLDIKVYSNPNLNAFKIIRGCPLLESFSLHVFQDLGDEEYYFNIPTLKCLELNSFRGIYIKKVVLNVPNLEELFVSGRLWSPVVMENFPTLVSVTLSCSRGPELDQSWVELLTGLSGAKSISMRILGNNPSISPMPRFLNLKHFEFRANYSYPLDWLLINQIIESSYELEHLCIKKKPKHPFFDEREDSCWIDPQSVPACMLNNLTSIKFVNFKGQQSDIPFMAYMLGNARVLKTVTIMWDSIPLEEELQLKAELLKPPRASRYCEIHFIASGSRSTST
uniref:putative F-box/FBD/LRR-repeat protein At4g13965 n=1 Tax=Erigeron canadensis TaxID=72917 RepID=UPI001CB8B4B1|nr:putative F-box/FBD/LRR-repeat protein At4g13965 [Erigeron canadensis]